ncbi:head-tail connector protein [Marivivens aquimaris]|uniref:head-tail connector protein n=1 Tax=Marivivens aquimaris TaxID=2774876 RepID=UPI00187F4D6A|nr:hypothetical protein [Marivivens aquimaris]
MMLTEQTPVPAAALPVAQFKDHLRLGADLPEDGSGDAPLQSCLRAAIAAIEARTGRILISRPFTWVIGQWRNPSEQTLPVQPVSDVTAIRLVDRSGSQTTASGFALAPGFRGPFLIALGLELPHIPAGGYARVELTAGYGETFDAIPADLAQAVLMLAAHYYDFRHGQAVERATFPPAVAAITARFQPIRMTAGARP